MATVHKYANLVKLEKSCKMNIEFQLITCKIGFDTAENEPSKAVVKKRLFF